MTKNLIDEKEFIKPYNPWKRFGVFLLFASVHMIGFYVLIDNRRIQRFLGETGLGIFALVTIAMPLVVALYMLLGNKDVILLPTKTKIGALFLFVLIYYMSSMSISIYEIRYNSVSSASLNEQFLVLGCYFAVIFIITLAIAIPVSNKRKKKHLLLNAIDN